MHVTCPNCSTKYNLPDKMFKPGAKARCTVCKHLFPLAAPVREMKPEHAPLNDESLDDLLGDNDASFGIDSKPAKKKSAKGGKKALVLVLLLLVLGGAGAGVFFFKPDILEDATQALVQSNASPEDVVATDNIKHLALRNIRQYYQPNEKVGQLFVIEGKVVNNFNVPKELVKVEATLFDASNVTLTSKQQYGGVTVSLFQLQVLGQQELESALNNKIEILTNNTNIAPGQEVPFMVVFYNPPANVAEFGVKVIEAKDPPKN